MASPSVEKDSSAPRILIVRLSAHGDVIHTLPLLTAVRRQFPHAVIGWLVDSSAVPLLENHPAIDHLHVWPRQFTVGGLLNPMRFLQTLQVMLALIVDLKARRYEISLDAQGLFKSAIWPVLAGIPQRLGFHGTRECADIFYTKRLPYRDIRSSTRLAADQTLDLARALGCTTDEPEFGVLPVSAQARQNIDRLLAQAQPGALQKPIVTLAPFTRWESKHWNRDAWIVLMKGLLAQNAQMIVVGAASDIPAVEQMLAELPKGHGVLNLAGKTEWTDLYALFERTRLMIGLDSGPLHIANAVGVPEIIGIYGPTPAARTGPIGRRHTVFEADLPCQPCFSKTCKIKTHDCMRKITPEQVLEAAKRYLQSTQEVLL
jgi:heptosyltransferase-1